MSALLALGGVTTPALAADGGMVVTTTQASPTMVSTIKVTSSSPDGQFDTIVTLNFDKPIDAKRADQYSRQLTAAAAHSRVAAQLGPAYISCDGSGDWSDSNGHLSMQYTCLSNRATLAWGFTVSPGLQAIIVSNISEQGLSWWLNGKSMLRNGPHNVPKYYQIHGSMTGASPESTVDYQDYITFRHNVGSGGTGSIAWAGRVHTLSS
jgi:hypothetical protein